MTNQSTISHDDVLSKTRNEMQARVQTKSVVKVVDNDASFKNSSSKGRNLSIDTLNTAIPTTDQLIKPKGSAKGEANKVRDDEIDNIRDFLKADDVERKRNNSLQHKS